MGINFERADTQDVASSMRAHAASPASMEAPSKEDLVTFTKADFFPTEED